MDCSLPGSSIHGIFQARILEWGAISFSRGSSWLRDWTLVSRMVGRRFTIWAKWEKREVWLKSICHSRKSQGAWLGVPCLLCSPIHWLVLGLTGFQSCSLLVKMWLVTDRAMLPRNADRLPCRPGLLAVPPNWASASCSIGLLPWDLLQDLHRVFFFCCCCF